MLKKIIKPTGFYKTKAKNIIETSKILVEKFGGKVPDNMEDLLKI
jgi:endonuclease-3